MTRRSFTPGLPQQAKDRAHRIGQGEVTIVTINKTGSDLIALIKKKRKIADKVLGKVPRITDAQFVALLWMRNHGKDRIVRWPGGFWTIPGMTHEKGKTDIPRWSCSTGTVMAMEKKGLITNVELKAPEWRAKRKITDLGCNALFRAEAINPVRRRKIIDNPDLWMLAESVKLEAIYNSKLPLRKRKIR